jgi:hypothetical protein
LDIDSPGEGGVGNVHFPVNGTSDYDYANPRFVQSNADAWLSYPNLNNDTRSFNFHEWSPGGMDPQREYLNWWYAHMPHVPGRAPDFYLANWWRYLLDLDQFKGGSENLYLTIGIPTARIESPAAGASVQGVVNVRASAVVDGALGRTDLYVDGGYYATDYLAPYTFAWNTAGLAPGAHTLVAKAYELQNGTEGVSPAFTVQVAPCAAPTITAQPVAQAVCPGGSASFTIAAAGDGQTSFQWRRDGMDLTDEPNRISGANAATLIIVNTTEADEGSYDCVVSNPCGSVTSDGGTLTICPADFNCSGAVNSQDFFEFLAAFFALNPRADFNHSEAIDSQDFFDFLAAFFTDCP